MAASQDASPENFRRRGRELEAHQDDLRQITKRIRRLQAELRELNAQSEESGRRRPSH